MKLIRFTILLLLALGLASNSKAQTSGGGPFTHGQTLSLTYNGGASCYPYQIAATSTGSVYSCVGGVATLPLGSGSGGSSQWITNSGNQGISTTQPVGIGTNSNTNNLNIMGGLGIGTTNGDAYLTTTAPNGGAIIYGNVGIGTYAPSSILNVTGSTIPVFNLTGGSGGSTVLISQLLNDGSNNQLLGHTSSGNQWGFGETFTLASSETITGASLGIGPVYQGSPSGTATMNISTTCGGSLVNANATASFTVATNTINAVTFTPFTVSAGTYCVFIPYFTIAQGNAWFASTHGSQPYSGGNTYDEINGSWEDIGDTTYNAVFTISVQGPQNSPGLQFQSSGSNTWKIYSNGGNNNALSFNNGSDQMVINSSNVGIGTATPQGALVVWGGNVGIGSATPGVSLDVQGAIRSSGALTVNGVNTSGTVTSSSANQVAYFPSAGTAVQGTSNEVVSGNNIEEIGNLGIGTTTMPNGLNVSTNVSIGTGYTNVSAPSNGLIVQGNVGIGTTFGNHALSVMSGNVGIGTWNPRSTFEIGGNGFTYNGVTYSGTTGSVDLVGSTSPSLTTPLLLTAADGSASQNGTLVLRTTKSTLNGTDAIIFQIANGVEVARIQNNGSGIANVGIGSTAPGQALDVNGTIRALVGGTCTQLYQCVGGVDAGIIQTSACSLCAASTCTAMNLCG